MIIAGVFEFLGAMVLGRVSVSTISGGIAIPAAFNVAPAWYCYDTTYCSKEAYLDKCGFLCDAAKASACPKSCNALEDRKGQIYFQGGNPVAYAYGMMWVLLVGTAWLLLTTYYGLNVSSTHSIIGGIIGFSLSYNKDAVNWFQVKYKGGASSCGQVASNGAVKNTACDSNAFPYSGIVPIVVAWFFAPTTTAVAAALLFLIVRTFVLRSANSYQRSFWLLPIFVFLTMFICIYFVFTKGAAATLNSDPDSQWSDSKSGWVSVVIAAGCAIIVACLLPLIRKRVESMIELEAQQERDFMQRRALRDGHRASYYMPKAEALEGEKAGDFDKVPGVAGPLDTAAPSGIFFGMPDSENPLPPPLYANDGSGVPVAEEQVPKEGRVIKQHFFYGGMGVQTDKDAVHFFCAEGQRYFREDLRTMNLCQALVRANARSMEIDRRFMHEDVMDVSSCSRPRGAMFFIVHSSFPSPTAIAGDGHGGAPRRRGEVRPPHGDGLQVPADILGVLRDVRARVWRSGLHGRCVGANSG